jgi:CDP-paratose 2-epimerase
MKKMLITGGAGFIGSNAAVHFVQKGWEVHLFDSLQRRGTESNLDALRAEIDVGFTRGDIRDDEAFVACIRQEGPFDAVLHLAAQVAVTTSVADPREDFEVNALGTFNVLESVRRHTPKAKVIFASTNKVYGDLRNHQVVKGESGYEFSDIPNGVDESTLLDFHSPYGCSKGAADQYMHDYSRIYGLRTYVLRQSCIYGTRQVGIEDQGWVAWFAIAALLGKPITVYGDGHQVRDLLWVEDLVDLYERCLLSDHHGLVLNVGGGRNNCLSVRGALKEIGNLRGAPLKPVEADWRPGDQKCFYSNNSAARRVLGWQPTTTVKDGLARLWAWVRANESRIGGIHST